MRKSERAVQARRELDRRFTASNVGPLEHRPHGGWVRAVRGALGMSQAALSARLGVAAPTLAKLERSEVNETISIGKLAEIARAMDCHLVYALVPNVSLEHTVQEQAERVASATLGYVAATMDLEDQGIDQERRADQLASQARRVIDANRQWSIT